MSVFPVSSIVGNPIFRAQGSSVDAIRRSTRMAADASIKLNTQERIVSPGEDALSFSTSRRIRSTVNALKVVQETGQLNITGLGVAVDALEGMKVQLDKIKKQLVQSQVADDSERDSIQAEIDLALSQVDSAAHNTKLGSRSLLNGSSTIQAYRSISNPGVITDFRINQGNSLSQNSGIQGVKVNKIGAGGPVKQLNDGTAVLSLNVNIASFNKATRATVVVSDGGGLAVTDFVELRVTGKLGSTTIRLQSADLFTNLGATATGFNQLATETGVILTSGIGGGEAVFTTVGFGSEEFVKVEYINSSGNAVDLVHGATPANLIDTSGDAIGTVLTSFGRAAKATINGFDVELGGKEGTTARFLNNGYDVEINFSVRGLSNNAMATSDTINVNLSQGVVGLLGATGDARDTLHYGYGTFTTEQLGRGNGINTVTTTSTTGIGGATAGNRSTTAAGNLVLNQQSIADLGTGGRLSLESGNFSAAIRTIDTALDQLISEQTRLGTLQSNFIDAVQRSEVLMGNLTSADADIIGVDAATEITNLVQAQLGASTASSVLSQANAIQSNIFSLLRG